VIQEKHTQVLLAVTIGLLVILVNVCGCTSKQNTNETAIQLSGTWVGNVEIPMSGGIMNASVSQITFTSTTSELTLNSIQGSFTMNCTYTMNGNTLVLQPTFRNIGGFLGQPPQNGIPPGDNATRPPMNDTWPTNGTRPPVNDTWPMNGTRPGNGTQPGNWTRLGNGTWNPGGGQLLMPLSFTYTLNEEQTVLYLNGAEFRKV
jgi:hypothetical protein